MTKCNSCVSAIQCFHIQECPSVHPIPTSVVYLSVYRVSIILTLWPLLLDDLLKIDNVRFEQMVNRIHLAEFQLNKANSSDTEAPFCDLNHSISNGTVSTKIYELMKNRTISILILLVARSLIAMSPMECIYLNVFISKEQLLMFMTSLVVTKSQECHYHKLHKAFSQFRRRHGGLMKNII